VDVGNLNVGQRSTELGSRPRGREGGRERKREGGREGGRNRTTYLLAGLVDVGNLDVGQRSTELGCVQFVVAALGGQDLVLLLDLFRKGGREGGRERGREEHMSVGKGEGEGTEECMCIAPQRIDRV